MDNDFPMLMGLKSSKKTFTLQQQGRIHLKKKNLQIHQKGHLYVLPNKPLRDQLGDTFREETKYSRHLCVLVCVLTYSEISADTFSSWCPVLSQAAAHARPQWGVAQRLRPQAARLVVHSELHQSCRTVRCVSGMDPVGRRERERGTHTYTHTVAWSGSGDLAHKFLGSTRVTSWLLNIHHHSACQK